jgi:adenine-specific DNA-methyltransferase
MTGMPPAVLVPVPGESVGSGAHQIIEGDNLAVLSHLGHSLTEQVKLVLIDPPYNTGRCFSYRDDPATDWVEMMRPRLVLARQLLRPDGAIIVHIDEHEQPRLSLLLDEIFGEDNRLGTIIWDKLNPKGDARGIATQHETILCHAKDKTTFLDAHPLRREKPSVGPMLAQAARLVAEHGTDIEGANAAFRRWIRGRSELSGGEAAYSRIDEDGQVFQAVSMAWPNKRRPPEHYFRPLNHPQTGKPCPVPARGWRNTPATMDKLLAQGRVVFGPTERTQPRRKYLLVECQTEPIPSVIRDGSCDDGLLEALGTPFDHPKPLSLTRRLIRWFTRDPGDLVLDFFAGSGTTGHAVLLENAQINQRTRVILVQSAEPIVAGSAAAAAGFQTVACLTRARMRAAIARLDAEQPAAAEEDRGFSATRLSPGT